MTSDPEIGTLMTGGSGTGTPRLAPITPADAPRLAAVHAAALDDLGQQPWPAAAFADLLALPTTLGLKITVEGELAAFLLAQVAAGEGEILTIATAPAFRRQGLARALIALLRDRCRRLQCRTLWLEVHAANTAARALYEQAGFAAKGQRLDYYQDVRTGGRHAAIIMQADVTD